MQTHNKAYYRKLSYCNTYENGFKQVSEAALKYHICGTPSGHSLLHVIVEGNYLVFGNICNITRQEFIFIDDSVCLCCMFTTTFKLLETF